MRRCLHAFFVGLLTLSVVTAPAHACWRSRQARRCRPVHVVHACPPPVWSAGCDPCGGAIAEVVTVSDVALCCPASPVAVASCGETVVVSEALDGSADPVGGGHQAIVSSEDSHPAASVAESAEPTLAAESPAVPSLEPITAPLALEPAGGVTPASNEQPAEPPVAATPVVPAAESVLAAPAGDASADTPVVPAQPVEPAAPAPAAEPKAADHPAEREPVAEEQPAPQAPPEPEEVNIFEQLDAGRAAAPATDEMPEEPAAVDPFADEPAEPAAPADEAAEPSAAEPARAEDPALPADEAAGGEPETAPADEEMTEDEAADADAEPADPFAADDEAARSAEPGEDQDDGAAEPAAADPFAAAEPSRRWIDATGAGSIVATLVAVVPDDHCVLETRGRRVVVPLENLSRHDRDYVVRAGERLATPIATAAAASPLSADTAGL